MKRSTMNLKRILAYSFITIIAINTLTAIEVRGQESQLGEIYSTDFESENDHWKFVDEGWKIAQVTAPESDDKTSDDEAPKDSQNAKNEKPNSNETERTKFAESKEAVKTLGVLSQYIKKSKYEPPFRSPKHMAILKDKTVTDFQLDVRVHSTHKDYNHRDACLFFGYQNPSQFYYVHLGKVTDPHANQIFIVNKAARTKISLTTTKGTPWDDNWHNVRVTRDIKSGEIKVYFDDMTTPVMTAVDKTFGWGQIGVGSFDDTADWDDLKLLGNLHAKEK